jgi:hypothetical protein
LEDAQMGQDNRNEKKPKKVVESAVRIGIMLVLVAIGFLLGREYAFREMRQGITGGRGGSDHVVKDGDAVFRAAEKELEEARRALEEDTGK